MTTEELYCDWWAKSKDKFPTARSSKKSENPIKLKIQEKTQWVGLFKKAVSTVREPIPKRTQL